MIPIRDRNPVQTIPILTIALIAMNVFVFLFLEPISSTPARQTQYFACSAAIPYEVTHGETLLTAARRGTLDDPMALALASHQSRACPRKNVWQSIFFSMFLHAGFLHIAGNMLFLWIFGNNVEDRLGKPKFAIFYLAAGLAATEAQAHIAPGSPVPLVGASGAIAGVLGAYILMFPRARITTLIFFFFIQVIELPASVVLGLWFILQLFSSVGSFAPGGGGGVAYMAHVAGFASGMLLLAILRPRARPPTWSET